MKFVWMFLGFLCLSAIVLAAPVDQNDVTVSDEEWENFKKEHGKNYATKEEEAKRRANYTKNMKEKGELFKKIPELNDPKVKILLDLSEDELKEHFITMILKQILALASETEIKLTLQCQKETDPARYNDSLRLMTTSSRTSPFNV